MTGDRATHGVAIHPTALPRTSYGQHAAPPLDYGPAAGAGRGTMSATWSGTFAVASAAEAAYRPANLAHETSANLVGPCRISTIVECGEVANVIERSIVPSVRMSAWRNFPIMSPFELPHG